MAGEYMVLSNFGVEYMLFPYTDSNTVPASGTDKDAIESVLSCDIGAFTKENTKYRTLNSNGWESVATLGNTAEDGSFECVREGTGGAYEGAEGTTSYTKIKDWFMKATEGAGKDSARCIIEVIPRGDDEYEGTCYYVMPNTWTPGTKDTETGQEYSFTVSPFGPQVPLVVTVEDVEGKKTYSFTKA